MLQIDTVRGSSRPDVYLGKLASGAEYKCTIFIDTLFIHGKYNKLLYDVILDNDIVNVEQLTKYFEDKGMFGLVNKVKALLTTYCNYYRIPITMFKSKSKTMYYAKVRKIFIILAYDNIKGVSFTDIANVINKSRSGVANIYRWSNDKERKQVNKIFKQITE